MFRGHGDALASFTGYVPQVSSYGSAFAQAGLLVRLSIPTRDLAAAPCDRTGHEARVPRTRPDALRRDRRWVHGLVLAATLDGLSAWGHDANGLRIRLFDDGIAHQRSEDCVDDCDDGQHHQ